ncbi:hypothetical protein [Paenibacillus segetis]|uniref:Uncharacterized protein n=1 Tax=Paenibacillus segetis TaxID=1325360 RepID=A0ABQ1Y4I3_9BACL|nr:hypothetical protein [Paenibacillus segetis]GGH11086.1 hypothetical protein GCM10008013_02780 [Paenibacillus segetis]
MLTDKELLLLCELANAIISSEIKISGKTMFECLRVLSDNSNEDEIVEEIISCPSLMHLHIQDFLVQDSISLILFTDVNGNNYGVVIHQNNELDHIHMLNELNEAIRRIEQIRGAGKCTLIGSKLGGLRAVSMAEQLQVEAVVFGAPSEEVLQGKAKNFVAENDPVGPYVEKVIFVKQKSTWEDNEEAYYKSLVFDEQGQAVVTEQSDYSKFVSWFYHTASVIHEEIWKIFFRKTEQEQQLMMEKELYSIYSRVDELNYEGMNCSIEHVIKYTENELNKNRNMLRVELKKIKTTDLEQQIGELADKLATQAIDIVNTTYRSVETIFMGVSLFNMDHLSHQIDPLMEKFNTLLNLLLKKELEQLTDALEDEVQSYLDEMLKFPDLVIDL